MSEFATNADLGEITKFPFKINRNQLHIILSETSQISSTFTDRIMIQKLLDHLLPILPLAEDPIRKLLIFAFYEYRKENTVPLEKFCLLEAEDRFESINRLKGFLESILSKIFDLEDPKALGRLTLLLDEFFEKYY